MAFPKYTEEHLIDFSKCFSSWGENMERLIKILYAPGTKYTNISRALKYFIYHNYFIGNNRLHRTYRHRKPEPLRTIMRIVSAPFEDLPLFCHEERVHKGVEIKKVISWRFKLNI